MEEQWVDPKHDESPPRPYEEPRLIEWGSLRDLTRGPELAGFEDFPQAGGSQGV
jgi:hypothetical protein